MINILNHNTSYKHSKFTARPMGAYIFDKNSQERTKIKSLDAVNKNVLTPASSKNKKSIINNLGANKALNKKSQTNAKKIHDLNTGDADENKTSLRKPAHGDEYQQYSRQKQVTPMYQSKELLCWRFDMSFLNLQDSFLATLKALHACWVFAKNNKTIIFVSTSKPTDTGSCAAVDLLLQEFPREFLPRIQTAIVSTKAKRCAAPSRAVQPSPELKKDQKYSSKEEKPSSILAELKKLINYSTLSKSNSNITEEPFDKVLINHFTYHKLEGLLTKAASRRLTASYSRTPTSFFSNTKKPFQEKFTHISNAPAGELRLSNQAFDPLRRLYPLNLNKPCAAKGTQRVKYPLSKQEKKWIDVSEPIAINQPVSQGYNRKNKSTKHGSEHSAQSLHALYNIRNSTAIKSLRASRKQNIDTKNKKSGLISKFQSGFRTLPNQGCLSYDFYHMWISAQAHSAAKRLANNPNLQQADLVFFTNPDRNPGLASQVKKLGIPSIGIVSGLKTTAYRKQPSLANLHDSVTYPIVGNPDNLIFVIFIIRIFAQLILKIDRSKSVSGVKGRFSIEAKTLQRPSRHKASNPLLNHQKIACQKTDLSSNRGTVGGEKANDRFASGKRSEPSNAVQINQQTSGKLNKIGTFILDNKQRGKSISSRRPIAPAKK